MANVRAFSWTLAVFALALVASWWKRDWVLGLWLPPLSDPLGFHFAIDYLLPSETVFRVTLKVVMATAALVTVPILGAEGWLFLCRVARRERARRLTLAFSLASTGAVVLALWLAVRSWSALLPYLCQSS